ncbi:MAG: restriction endonuclease [Thermoleophilia bacterium]|nr:restriction endonuclease [Thermoleophilia bacterium]
MDRAAATDAARRGRDLERVVADLFSAHGYSVTPNVLLTGRSGARHEVDVLARRADGLVTHLVGVECKHWAEPVGTEVVARARLLRDDLGLSQVVVACPGGAGPAARSAAAEHGVELWDRDELGRRLAAAAMAALEPVAAREPALGMARRLGGADAADRLRSRARGPWGALRERITWVRDAWLPVHELPFDCARATGRRRHAVEVTRAYVTYEAVTGSALAGWPAECPTEAVDLAGAGLPALVAGSAVAERIARAFERSRSLSQPAARARHAAALAEALVPADLEDLAVGEPRTYAWPVTVALLERGDVQRLAVLDGVSGNDDPDLAGRLTTRLAVVSRTLSGPPPPPSDRGLRDHRRHRDTPGDHTGQA